MGRGGGSGGSKRGRGPNWTEGVLHICMTKFLERTRNASYFQGRPTGNYFTIGCVHILKK